MNFVRCYSYCIQGLVTAVQLYTRVERAAQDADLHAASVATAVDVALRTVSAAGRLTRHRSLACWARTCEAEVGLELGLEIVRSR